MNRIKRLIMRQAYNLMAVFALAFAVVSTEQFCFYIFHQPHMPKDVIILNKK